MYLGQLIMLVKLPIRTSGKVLKRQTTGCLWSGKGMMIHLIVGLIKLVLPNVANVTGQYLIDPVRVGAESNVKLYLVNMQLKRWYWYK